MRISCVFLNCVEAKVVVAPSPLPQNKRLLLLRTHTLIPETHSKILKHVSVSFFQLNIEPGDSEILMRLSLSSFFSWLLNRDIRRALSAASLSRALFLHWIHTSQSQAKQLRPRVPSSSPFLFFFTSPRVPTHHTHFHVSVIFILHPPPPTTFKITLLPTIFQFCYWYRIFFSLRNVQEKAFVS